MKSLIKSNLKNYFYDKRKLLVLIVFAFFCGSNIQIAKLSGMTIYEYALFVMGNQYYLIYFMFMTYLFFCFDMMKDENQLVLIRIKSIKNQYLCYIVSSFLQAAAFVMAHIVLIFAVGVSSLEIKNTFMAGQLGDYYNDTLDFLLQYKKFAGTSVSALAAEVLFLIIGFTFVSVFVYIIRNIGGKKAAIGAISILILDMMAGFKIGIHGMIEVFFINNYFILHHVLFMSGAKYVKLNLIVMAAVIISGYFLIRYFRGNKRLLGRDSYIEHITKGIYKTSIIYLFFYVVFNIIPILLSGDVMAWQDFFISNLAGYSGSNFYFLEFIRYLLFFLIPLFVIGNVMEREKNTHNMQLKIRYGSRRKWEKLLEKSINQYLLVYIIFFGILILCFSVLISLTGRNGTSEYFESFIAVTGLTQNEIYQAMFLSFVLKAMELFFYKNIFQLIEQITNNNVAAYIITFMGFAVSFTIPGRWFVSYGCSSIYYFADDIATKGIVKTATILIAVLIVKIVITILLRRIICEQAINLRPESR